MISNPNSPHAGQIGHEEDEVIVEIPTQQPNTQAEPLVEEPEEVPADE